METSGLQECSLASYVLAHGSELCMEGKCIICSDGDWEDKMDVYPKPPTVNPKEV